MKKILIPLCLVALLALAAIPAAAGQGTGPAATPQGTQQQSQDQSCTPQGTPQGTQQQNQYSTPQGTQQQNQYQNGTPQATPQPDPQGTQQQNQVQNGPGVGTQQPEPKGQGTMVASRQENAAMVSSGPGLPPDDQQPAPQGQGTMSTARQGKARSLFTISGTITAVDPANASLTVSVMRGNKLVQPFFNTEVTILTNASTRFLLKESRTLPAVEITFADLQVGDAVSINGLLSNDTWAASRITVGASQSCLP